METARTGWHRKIEVWMDENKISYDSENEEFHPYRLDVYLPDHHGCIEIDGPKHTSKRDDIRDQVLLEKYGVSTLRLNARKGLRRQDTMNKIHRFIESISGTKAERYEKFISAMTEVV